MAAWVQNLKGGTVAFVLNQEGGAVLGGRFCFGRAVLSCVFPVRVSRCDVITLQRQNDPPGTESPSREREDKTEERVERLAEVGIGWAEWLGQGDDPKLHNNSALHNQS